MGKMIIVNETDLSDLEVLECVMKVVMEGRISNGGKQYCRITTMEVNGDQVVVSTVLNKCSDKFIVRREYVFNFLQNLFCR